VAVLFPRWTNKVPLALAAGLPLGLVAVVFAVWYWFSPRYTDVGYQPDQPIAFSHAQHVGELGFDCRYCHNTVEQAPMAAVPPSQTCLNCHRLIQPNSPRLALLRGVQACLDSEFRRPDDPCPPIEWVRVHMLPDYAYFDHSAHVMAGVGCVECHGRIDQMVRVRQVEPLSMSWCVDCHRNPGPAIRPPGVAVTQMDWVAPEGHNLLVTQTGREANPPLHCSGCHR
jgi:hypothetical protein